MAIAPTLRSRMSAAARAWFGSEKSIWGQTWRDLMGIAGDGSGGDVQPIGAQPGDRARARTAESYVYTAEEVRARAISQVPLRIYKLDAEGNRKGVVEHEALDILARTNPFGYVAGIPRLMRYTLGSMDFHGRSAWKMAFDRRGKPSEVYWQIPTQYTPIPDPKLFFGGIRLHDELGVRVIPPTELCYFTNDNPENPLLGTSKIDVLKGAINLRQYSTANNIAFFKNSMRPDWMLSGSFSNTEDNINRIRRAIRRMLSGANNRAPLILGEGMTAHLLTTSHEDAQWLEQQRLSQEEISAAFRVPLIFLNNYDRATYDNITTARLMLWHDGMIPDCDDLAEDLTRIYLWMWWPETQRARYHFGFDYNRIEGLGEDLARVWERMTKLMHEIDAQVLRRQLTPNQAREVYVQAVAELGLDVTPWKGEVPGGDTFYESWQNIPIEEMSLQSVINAQAARGPNPQLEEDVPGAPNAAENALKPNPNQAKPTLPPASTPPAKSADILDLDAFRKEVAQAAGEAALQAIGEHLKAVQKAPIIRKGPHPIPIRDARLGPIQKRMVGRLKKHFQGLQAEALKRVRGTVQAPKAYVDPNLGLYDAVAATASLAVIIQEAADESAQAAYAAAAEDYSLKVVWNEGNPWLAQYMGGRLALIQGIDDNLRERLKSALLASAEAGDSIQDIARAVREVFQEAIDYRSELIARTETIQAYGRASIAAYRDAGVAEAEMYDGLNDDSADCLGVNGMVVSLQDADRLMQEEHPMGTRGVAPLLPGGPEELGVPNLLIAKSQLYATERRAPTHDHSTEAGDTAIVVYDLHGTLTPSPGFTEWTEDTGLLPPFPGVKEGLDLLAAGGCCLHMATAALSPMHSPDVLAARRKAIDAWLTRWGLPISFVTGKVGAHVYYDDRMVSVTDGNWATVMADTLSKLNKRFDCGPDGIWRRQEIPEVGHEFEYPPPELIAGDQPRPFSTPVIDVDMHRCLTQASSSTLNATPKPGAQQAMQAIYAAGYIIHISCQGWDPTTHTPEESAQRLAGMRQWCRINGLPFDEFVSKDHGDVFVDDKGVGHVNWKTDLPVLLARLVIPHPEDEVTQRPDEAVPAGNTG